MDSVPREYMRGSIALGNILIDNRRAQYTTKFNNWGWQKNNKRKYYEDIDRSLKRRRLSLADADISIKGTRCSVKKLKKEIARYADKDVHSNITVDRKSASIQVQNTIRPDMTL